MREGLHGYKGNGDMPPDPKEGISIETGIAKVGIYGKKNLIGILTFALVAIIAWLLYEHRIDVSYDRREMTKAVRSMTAAIQENNCLISMSQDAREKEYRELAGNSRNSKCRVISEDRAYR